MDYLEIAIKLIVGLSVLNVWLFRANKATPWRGGTAKSLKEEFEAYGLNESIMKLVGAVKIILAVLILASIFYQPAEQIGAIGMAVMMIGAIVMHIRIKDPLQRSFPAFSFLLLSIVMLVI
ncbi:MAG: DoxX family protein [Saprospiraceae bacterium]|nr:DoxX family protein [Saprospiraceae bacterium]